MVIFIIRFALTQESSIRSPFHKLQCVHLEILGGILVTVC